MVAFILLLGALCLYKIDFANPKTNFDDYLSIEKTNSIKGIFILIVIFQHFNQYVEYSSFIDVQYLRFFNCIGQRMVTLFLFYSGYGIRESIAKKGSNYIKTIPTKRIGGGIV